MNASGINVKKLLCMHTVCRCIYNANSENINFDEPSRNAEDEPLKPEN